MAAENEGIPRLQFCYVGSVSSGTRRPPSAASKPGMARQRRKSGEKNVARTSTSDEIAAFAGAGDAPVDDAVAFVEGTLTADELKKKISNEATSAASSKVKKFVSKNDQPKAPPYMEPVDRMEAIFHALLNDHPDIFGQKRTKSKKEFVYSAECQAGYVGFLPIEDLVDYISSSGSKDTTEPQNKPKKKKKKRNKKKNKGDASKKTEASDQENKKDGPGPDVDGPIPVVVSN